MISDKLEKYALSYTSPEDPLLRELYRETNLKTMYPRMLSGPVQGKLLEMLSRMIQPKYILEIGTFTGYSALCLARGLQKQGTLVTIELSPEMVDFAGRYFKLAGLEGKIRQETGHALEIIPSLDYEWDLVFIDADKENYLNYYKLVFERLRPGGYVLADNVLWGGKVLEPRTGQDRETRGITEFNEFVRSDPRVDKVLLPLRDGLMVLRKL